MGLAVIELELVQPVNDGHQTLCGIGHLFGQYAHGNVRRKRRHDARIRKSGQFGNQMIDVHKLVAAEEKIDPAAPAFELRRRYSDQVIPGIVPP